MKLVASLVLVAVVVLMTMQGRCLALSCGPCNKNSCPDVTYCKHGTALSVCNCCELCRKGPGDTCGGPWGSAGKCKKGFKCLPNLNTNHLPPQLSKHLLGTCKRVPEVPFMFQW